jgi:hypothetical protein
LNIF